MERKIYIMKLKTTLIPLLVLINSGNIIASQPENLPTLKDLLKKSLAWTISVSASPFKKPTLKVFLPTEVNNDMPLTEQTFPVCSQEEAKEVSSSLCESFRGLPAGYSDCLRTILTGENDQELLSISGDTGMIKDKKYANATVRDSKSKQ